MKNLKKILLGICLIASIFIFSSMHVRIENTQTFGATNAIPTPIALFQTSLASGITSTATSMTLVSGTDKDGNSLSGTYAFIIDEGTANEEFVNADCTATACTNMTRGLSVVTGTTSITALKHEHRRGSSVKITDAPQLLILHRIVNGISTFPNKLGYTSHPTFSSNTDIIDKKYADDLAIAGSPDATTTTKGILKMSTAPVSPTSPIAVGDNDTRVSTQGENDAQIGDNTDIAVGSGNKFVTQTGLQKSSEVYAASATGNDTYVATLSPVPTSYDNGRHYFIKVDVGNTGAATINFNSLGAVSIVNAVSTSLATGDMLANGIYELIYNSTGPVFQLTNPASMVLTDNTPTVYNSTPNTNTSNNYYTYTIPILVTSSSTLAGWATSSLSASSPAGAGGTSGPLSTSGTNWSISSNLPGINGSNSYIPNNGKTISIKFRLLWTGTTSQNGFGATTAGSGSYGDQTNNTPAFRIVNNAGTLYAVTGNGSGVTATNITGSLTLTNFNTYEIVFTPGVSALFYANGSLVATHTTNLPTSDALQVVAGSANASGFNLFPIIVSVQM